jgi:hypothetical protein
MTVLSKKAIALVALIAPFALIGCGSSEPEVDSNLEVKSMKDLKPGEPSPSRLSAPGGGGAPAGGAPQAPSSE